MTEHTPGPWKVIEDPFSEGIVAIIQHDEFGLLAVGSCEDRAATGEEDHYNAHLIAAAPDLLAALEEISALTAYAGRSMKDEAVCDVARAAIARARGEQP